MLRGRLICRPVSPAWARARDRGRAGGSRRLVAERAGNALGAVAALARLAAGLLAAHRGLLRIVVLARLLGDREIEIRGYGRAHAAGADHGLEQLDDAPLVALLELARVFELPRADRGLRSYRPAS